MKMKYQYWIKKNITFSLIDNFLLAFNYLVIIGLILFGIFYQNDFVKEIRVNPTGNNEDSVRVEVYNEFATKVIRPYQKNEEKLVRWSAIIIAGIFVLMVRNGRKSDQLVKKIEETQKDFGKNLLAKGVHEIFDDVNEEIRQLLAAGQTIEIDIIAFTLFSIMPQLKRWKKLASNTKGRKPKNLPVLNLYHLDRDYIKSAHDIHPDWLGELDRNLSNISEFKAENEGIIIHTVGYKHLPAVHGFRINGTLYVAIANWDEKLLIEKPDYAGSIYIRVVSNDHSTYSNYLRMLFENWLGKSRGMVNTLSDYGQAEYNI